jgi:hypothetical protein
MFRRGPCRCGTGGSTRQGLDRLAEHVAAAVARLPVVVAEDRDPGADWRPVFGSIEEAAALPRSA